MPQLSILNTEGKETEAIDLPDSIFGTRVNQDVLHQAVVMYQAAQRQGTASTKDRSQVSGGGIKPFRQKGTGRARAGSNRSPLWHKGGVVFGPHPREFRYPVSQRIRSAALRESLNAKYQSKDLLCVDSLDVSSHRTKDFVKLLFSLNLKGKVLALADKQDINLVRASRNVSSFTLMRPEDVNAYDVLRNKKVLITKSAFKNLLKRIKE